MLASFVKGSPALAVRRWHLLVIGDMHIGKEFKLAKAGIHFPNASQRMAEQLLALYRKSGAHEIIMLGDVKESIGYPPREELEAIAAFFHLLRGIKITVVRGNHDAHLAEILGRIGMNRPPVAELLLKRIAFIHGNAMPSDQAMGMDYIISAHSHTAISVAGRIEKGWLVAGIGPQARRRYSTCNKKIKLIVMPAFSPLITGVSASSGTGSSLPLFRNGIFDEESARMYDLDGNEVALAATRHE